MSYTDYYLGQEVVFYTDGLCFANLVEPLPGITSRESSFATNSRKSTMFCIQEGIWWIPSVYRICIYTATEIHNGEYLDITKRIEVPPNIFIYLEEEPDLTKAPIVAGASSELYYDITFMKEPEVLTFIENNLHLISSGNLPQWKNQIQIMDKIYG